MSNVWWSSFPSHFFHYLLRNIHVQQELSHDSLRPSIPKSSPSVSEDGISHLPGSVLGRMWCSLGPRHSTGQDSLKTPGKGLTSQGHPTILAKSCLCGGTGGPLALGTLPRDRSRLGQDMGPQVSPAQQGPQMDGAVGSRRPVPFWHHWGRGWCPQGLMWDPGPQAAQVRLVRAIKAY